MVSCTVPQLTDSGATLQVDPLFGIPSAFRRALNEKAQNPCWAVRKSAKELKVTFTDRQLAAEAVGAWCPSS